MSVRRPATVLAMTAALLVTSVQVPGAGAHELVVNEDSCTITYTERDRDKVIEGLNKAIVESYDQMSRSIPATTAYDISLVTNYVFDNWGTREYSRVEDFRGTPVNGIATRLNRHAMNAGFRGNEIFEIIRFQYAMSLEVVTARSTVMDRDEPLTMSRQEAVVMANGIRTADLAPRGEFSRAGKRSVDFLAERGKGLLEQVHEPVIACAYGDASGDGPGTHTMVPGSSGSS